MPPDRFEGLQTAAPEAGESAFGFDDGSGRTPSGIRVFVVSDVTLYREGLESMLGREPALDVVGSASAVHDAISAISIAAPDVVLLDTDMEGGVEAARELRTAKPEVKLIALSLLEAEREVIPWAEAGIAAYVTR
ncbi:MAG TPA: response regulator transcription factor, partial [Actinomycetota bacterium]|nr:response regulator transcription factor [Actinomycetota bacterium]